MIEALLSAYMRHFYTTEEKSTLCIYYKAYERLHSAHSHRDTPFCYDVRCAVFCRNRTYVACLKGAVMSSPVGEVNGGTGDEGGVELTDVHVLPADETKADGTTNEGFDAQGETETPVDSPEQETVDSKPSPQVNQLCLACREICFVHAFCLGPTESRPDVARSRPGRSRFESMQGRPDTISNRRSCRYRCWS